LVAFGALTVRTLWAAYPDRDPRIAEGVVLIDEVDLHQDASIAPKLPGALRAALPSVQWILTTHSPLLAAGVAPGEVLALRAGTQGRVELHAGPSATTH
jgi:predicted ATP-binding protein involved in virulence